MVTSSKSFLTWPRTEVSRHAQNGGAEDQLSRWLAAQRGAPRRQSAKSCSTQEVQPTCSLQNNVNGA